MSTPRGFKEAGVELPRRMYQAVTVEAGEGGWSPLLDGRAPRTPAGARLNLPTWALAELAAEEWDAQGERIVFATMPAVRLAFTAIDRIAGHRAEVAEEVVRYAGSDLLCYFAESPPALLERQEQAWGPLLAWAERDLALRFERRAGVVHRPQPTETLARVRALATAEDDFALAGLAHAAALLGSAVLALALRHGRVGAVEAFALSRLDETFQEEQWGVDAEAAERTAALGQEALLLERWFAGLPASA